MKDEKWSNWPWPIKSKLKEDTNSYFTCDDDWRGCSDERGWMMSFSKDQSHQSKLNLTVALGTQQCCLVIFLI